MLCHGRHGKSSHPRYLHKLELSRDIIFYVESCFFMDVPVHVVYNKHIEPHIDMDVGNRVRVLFFTRKHVANIYHLPMKHKHQFHSKDEMSVNIWYYKQLDSFFLFWKPNAPNVPFFLSVFKQNGCWR